MAALAQLKGYADMDAPKRGTRFVHTYWTDTNNAPLSAIVTAVRQGLIYYRLEGQSKARQFVAMDEWPKIVKTLL